MRVIMRPNVHIQPDPFFFIWWSLRYYNIHWHMSTNYHVKMIQFIIIIPKPRNFYFVLLAIVRRYNRKEKIYFWTISVWSSFCCTGKFWFKNPHFTFPLKDMGFWRCFFQRNEVCLIKFSFKWRSKYFIWKVRCSANFWHPDQCF